MRQSLISVLPSNLTPSFSKLALLALLVPSKFFKVPEKGPHSYAQSYLAGSYNNQFH